MSLIYKLDYFIYFKKMNVHLIAIGGSAMHNIALALHDKGFNVSGSDDYIFNPSKDRLKKKGLLPSKLGWFPDRINRKTDAVILGMHAKSDNPELLKAQKLKIPIYSYPEYIFNQSKEKKRIVIAGSHGKTSITSMILHVLQKCKIECDYMVGAQLDGFDNMVKLTKENKIIILEGDEYLSSPIDMRPKFLWYKPHIAVVSGIAWDHINVFPTFISYLNQFKTFIKSISETLIYFDGDTNLNNIINKSLKCKLIPYNILSHEIDNGITFLKIKNNNLPLHIFGDHNLQNLNAAKSVCDQLGVSEFDFFKAINSFKGASKRLEVVLKLENATLFKDFAHSPSKLLATISAVKKQFKTRKLVACIELFTFSSLNKNFLNQYKGSMDNADTAIVYYNPKSLEKKKSKFKIKTEDIFKSFGREDLIVFDDSKKLKNYINSLKWNNKNLLMMSSGNFDEIDFQDLIRI